MLVPRPVAFTNKGRQIHCQKEISVAKAPKHMRASDLRGLAQLATLATTGVISIAEGVHQSVLSTLGLGQGPSPGQTGGLTGLVYQSVLGATQLVGKGIDNMLLGLESRLGQSPDAGTPQREAVLAALNGVLGDRLAASNNPLATPMTLRADARIGSRVLLLIHGLCMNDLQWQPQHQQLSADLDCAPVYVRYNTGLHISQNGRQLALQLEQLTHQWPQPLTHLTVVAHSMGGLVTRSAYYYAQQQAMTWPACLKTIVFLGTPHHGSPLERAGNWVDTLLSSTPYTAPFSRLGKMRSAGITDLRYGHVVDDDWQGRDRFHRQPDQRQPIPLPQGVACYTVAATLASRRSPLADRLIGDGLVPLHSALGHHEDPHRDLHFPSLNQWIAYRTNHLELLTSPQVLGHLKHWLGSQV